MTPGLFAGVLPAITTPFDEDGRVDHPFLARHAGWLLDRGCEGLVALGSLGEGATLEAGEKQAVLETLVAAVGERAPVIASVSALSTAQAVGIARMAEAAGCAGLMVLPAYVHRSPWREIEAHFEAVLDATGLPCMLYNNPAAYGVDVLPEQIVALAHRWPALAAVKESSGDVRRITALHALAAERLALLVGLDDVVVEGVLAGARGWVAGLANALPEASVRLFDLARDGELDQARALYRWFLPLLRMDTTPEFVQLIKLVQQEVGIGSERVRPPRQPVRGELRESALATIRSALDAASERTVAEEPPA